MSWNWDGWKLKDSCQVSSEVGEGSEIRVIKCDSFSLYTGLKVDLTVRTCVVDAPLSHHSTMDSLICPAPPTYHPEISGEMIQKLVVPTPSGK